MSQEAKNVELTEHFADELMKGNLGVVN